MTLFSEKNLSKEVYLEIFENITQVLILVMVVFNSGGLEEMENVLLEDGAPPHFYLDQQYPERRISWTGSTE